MPSSGWAASSASAASRCWWKSASRITGSPLPSRADASSGRSATSARTVSTSPDVIAVIRRLAHSRRMPQTSSATSFVNAASWKKLGGLPREVSENATVPSSIRTR